eukprot:25511-Chlamydomonas_euryale.AAC.2
MAKGGVQRTLKEKGRRTLKEKGAAHFDGKGGGAPRGRSGTEAGGSRWCGSMCARQGVQGRACKAAVA